MRSHLHLEKLKHSESGAFTTPANSHASEKRSHSGRCWAGPVIHQSPLARMQYELLGKITRKVCVLAKSSGHHRLTFEAARLALGASAARYLDFFVGCAEFSLGTRHQPPF
jgi:hypothetical protein